LVKIFNDIPGAIWPIAMEYFKHIGISLTITDEAALLIADRAAKKNRLGARALREVFGKVVKSIEFDPLASGLVDERDGQRVLEITKAVVEDADAG
jgi:ATP-dependent protease Clp ATPase subunit